MSEFLCPFWLTAFSFDFHCLFSACLASSLSSSTSPSAFAFKDGILSCTSPLRGRWQCSNSALCGYGHKFLCSGAQMNFVICTVCAHGLNARPAWSAESSVTYTHQHLPVSSEEWQHWIIGSVHWVCRSLGGPSFEVTALWGIWIFVKRSL